MSTLSGNYIANTFTKLLQIDDSTSTSPFKEFDGSDLSDLNSNDKHAILNGSGEKVQAFLVDHSDAGGNGGIFIKDVNSDTSVWQFKLKLDNNEPGLAIARTYGGGTRLFLKNTGSLWVGDPSVTSDDSNTSLYVKKGIRLGLGGQAIIKAPSQPLHLKASPSGVAESSIGLGINASGQPGANWANQQSPHSGQQHGSNMLQSGRVLDNDCNMVWQRVGNVVHVSGVKSFPSGPSITLPLYKGGWNSTTTYDYVIGNGIQSGSDNRIVEVHGDGLSTFHFKDRWGNIITNGAAIRFSMSYNIRP